MPKTTTSPNKTYIIRNKNTGEQFVATSGKSSWRMPAHAKNAWNCSGDYKKEAAGVSYKEETRWGYTYKNMPNFNEQDIFEVVELKHETEDQLSRAIQLLKMCQGRVEYTVANEIEDFLEEVGGEH